MIDLPLSHDEHSDLVDTLFNSHVIDVDFRIYDQNEDPMGGLNKPANRVLDGSIQCDATAEISRSMELTILDPYDSLHFESHNPAHAAVFADRFISAHYGVYVPSFGDFFYIPVFRGVLTEYGRDGMTVNIEAQSKEALMLDPHFATKGFTIKHRERIDDAIKRVARKVGERRFAMPDIPQRIHNDHVVAATAELWNIIAGGKHVEGLKSIHKVQSKDSKDKTEREVHQNVPAIIRLAPKNRSLIYDGRGRLTTHRRGNDDVQFVFRDGPSAQGTGRGPSILTRPTVSYDETEFRNHVVVRGGTPKGKKRLIVAESLPPHHPLSPHQLARNGEPRWLTSFVDADNLKTWDECKKRARDELKDLKDAGVTVDFECLPLPMLEPGDFVRVQTSGFKFDYTVNQFTLPLTPDQPMTMGRTVKVHKFARHHHRDRPKKKKHGGKHQFRRQHPHYAANNPR